MDGVFVCGNWLFGVVFVFLVDFLYFVLFVGGYVGYDEL